MPELRPAPFASLVFAAPWARGFGVSHLMFVLIVGCGRVGSAVARQMLSEGHEVSVLDEDPEAIAQLEKGEDQDWVDKGGSFTVGTALEIEALEAAGIERAD